MKRGLSPGAWVLEYPRRVASNPPVRQLSIGLEFACSKIQTKRSRCGETMLFWGAWGRDYFGIVMRLSMVFRRGPKLPHKKRMTCLTRSDRAPSILYGYLVGSLDFHFFVEISDFPLDPQKVKLFAEKSMATKFRDRFLNGSEIGDFCFELIVLSKWVLELRLDLPQLKAAPVVSKAWGSLLTCNHVTKTYICKWGEGVMHVHSENKKSLCAAMDTGT